MPGDDKLKWRKIGHGSFKLARGKIVKPNEVFTAREDEIPLSFRDLIVRVTSENETDKTQTTSAAIATPFLAVPADIDKTLEEFAGHNEAETEEPVTHSDGKDGVEVKARYPGWYDVINSVTGKRINEHRLKKADADKLCGELS